MQQPKRKEPDRKAPLHSSATRRLDRQRPGTASRQALPGAERGRCGYRKGDIGWCLKGFLLSANIGPTCSASLMQGQCAGLETLLLTTGRRTLQGRGKHGGPFGTTSPRKFHTPTRSKTPSQENQGLRAEGGAPAPGAQDDPGACSESPHIPHTLQPDLRSSAGLSHVLMSFQVYWGLKDSAVLLCCSPSTELTARGALQGGTRPAQQDPMILGFKALARRLGCTCVEHWLLETGHVAASPRRPRKSMATLPGSTVHTRTSPGGKATPILPSSQGPLTVYSSFYTPTYSAFFPPVAGLQ
ncbi:hypothetical protein CB1_000309004 [Camelus ferus]|nr:hypothetical protein CB1_000309004 [Camelus ferus]